MFDSEVRRVLKQAFGYPYTTKTKVRDGMGFKEWKPIRKYFRGLPHNGRNYYTDDVIERIMQERRYEERSDY